VIQLKLHIFVKYMSSSRELYLNFCAFLNRLLVATVKSVASFFSSPHKVFKVWCCRCSFLF